MIPLLSQLPGQYSTVILVLLLIAAFIVAYKVMKIVFQTVTVTVLSGAFYVALAYLLNLSFSLNHLLFYAVLGASLYMGFTLLASAYRVAGSLISIPYKILKIASVPLIWLYRSVRNKADVSSMKNIKKKTGRKSGSSQEETKEVVLDKVMNREKDKDDRDEN